VGLVIVFAVVVIVSDRMWCLRPDTPATPAVSPAASLIS
jgi:hypothetical protein